MRLTNKQKEARRALWMREFEQCVLSRRPQDAGRIDWTSPTYWFGLGDNARDAAEKYVFNRL